MPEVANALLLVLCAAVYFAALAALFFSRARVGIGAFFCALGVMHFIETYLASNLYVALPFGVVASPGSAVLFTGKLLLLLLVYIREDAAVVRQPIYGLLFGNLLIVALGVMLRHTTPAVVAPGQTPDFGFIDQTGGLMVWGTLLLFVDCIFLILAYERSRAWLGDHVGLRLWLCSAAVLTFDQAFFFVGLNLLVGADLSVMLGGWVAKMAAAALYSGLVAAYLRHAESPGDSARTVRSMADVFGTLTYRERYEDLVARSGHDALTGLFDRGQLETAGRRRVDEAIRVDRFVTLFIIDIDHFKRFNDKSGHAAGDAVLRRIAASIGAAIRHSDLAFRYGGEEFVVVCEGLSARSALALGENLRARIAAIEAVHRVTVSIGVATAPEDGADYDALFALADERLYRAKAEGRNRVVGIAVADAAPARQLAYTA